MKTLLFKFGFLFLVVSCNSSYNESHVSNNDRLSTDNRNERHFTEAMENITKKLNLPNLKNGVDSFELRIWCPMSAAIQNLITIRYIYSKWNISETYVWEKYPDRPFKRNDTSNHMIEVIIDSTKLKNIYPKIDKQKFIDTLLNNYILNFPLNADFEGSFKIGRDSYRYIFELAQKGKYKRVDYDCGGSIESKKELHDKIRNLLNFIRRQLNENIPYCN